MNQNAVCIASMIVVVTVLTFTINPSLRLGCFVLFLVTFVIKGGHNDPSRIRFAPHTYEFGTRG